MQQVVQLLLFCTRMPEIQMIFIGEHTPLPLYGQYMAAHLIDLNTPQ